MMRTGSLVAGALAALVLTSSAYAVELDPAIVGFKLPNQIEWKDNPEIRQPHGGAAGRPE